MKKGIFTRLSFPVTLIVFTVISMTAISQTLYRDYIDGRVYLKFKDQVQVNIPVNSDGSINMDNAPFLDALRQQFDITGITRPYDLNNDPKLLRTFELSFSQFDKIEKIKEKLAENTDLEYVENVPMYYIDYVPNDSIYNKEYMANNWNWHLDVINAEMGWDVSKGSEDIKVAIVDCAVWIDHPDLANKIVLSHDVTTAGNQNSNPPANGDPAAWSHGTHCAGLAGAESDNLIGVASIGYNVSLIGVKCSSSNPEQITAGFAGIQWAANNGANVISCSWGGSGYSSTEQTVLNNVYNLGIVVVAAAGNNGLNTPHYPSAYNHVISVASTNENDVKSDFSNFGATIDVCSPGGYSSANTYGVISTTWAHTSYGYYDIYAGTSMACPIAAGLCGLIFSINPDLSVDQLESVLEGGCDFIDDVPGNEAYAGQLGAGRIEAYKSLITTPYQPAADFSTPVTTIMTGSSIQFADKSAGVPDNWSWEFTGGSPHLSSQKDPSVTYLTEGVYTVYLGVDNDFGSDVETKTAYITVTSTPLPWVEFSANANTVCNLGTLIFTDETLYEPSAWEWDFSPSTVTYTDGTTLNSQNPHVQFDAPGIYTVTLTAVNANGSNFKTIQDMITVEGVALNYTEDFETGKSNDFVLSAAARARIKVDTRAAAPGSTNGLHFEGYFNTGGWSGGPANTTPDQAWNVNTNFHAFADICSVDATGADGVGLTLDLRQTYSIGSKYSWFRVLADGEQVSDVYGVEDFNPTSNTDQFVTKIFDLSEYGNSIFSLTLQSACYLSDKFFSEGDNVFVDNIEISNTTSVGEVNSAAGVITYPNPVTSVLNYSARGTGNQITVKVLNLQGQTIMQQSIKGYKEGDVRQINTGNLGSGLYILRISGDKGTTVKKFLVE